MLINYKMYKYISLRIHTAWSEYLQGTLWVDKNPKHFQVDSEDSDQPAQLRDMCPGSYVINTTQN